MNAMHAVSPGPTWRRRRKLKIGSSTGPVVLDRRARGSMAAGLATVIDKRHHAHLGIDVRHDANGPPRFDVAVEMSEFSLVSVKRVFAFIAGLAQRLISNGPDLAGSQVTDVAELTPAIARQI